MNVYAMISDLKKLWQKKESNPKKMTPKEKWILFFLIGLLIIVLWMPMKNNDAQVNTLQPFGEENSKAVQPEAKNMREYEEELSEQLVKILEQIDGAGKVDAWVTISESEEVLFSLEKTEEVTSLDEQDSAGGKRTEETKSFGHTVIVDSDGNPYITKTIQPKVEGVLVVAEGAGNSVVKKNISEAVEVLFDIDAHRIKVAKKKLEE